jgi:ubiquinone/menaquinone biosynthesis C-methylase UbiE
LFNIVAMNPQLRRDIIQWDIKNWSKALPFWEPHLPSTEARVLTLGERHGGLTLWFAKAGFNVTSTDLEGVSDEAKALHQKHDVAALIKYQNADMLALPFADNSFDVIAFKSVLGALSSKENQQQAIDEIHRVLVPGGTLIFAENLIGTGFHNWIRKKFVKWSTYWRYLHPKKDLDLFHKFDSAQHTTQGFFALFGRSESQRSFLAGIDAALQWMIPKSKRYIMFGVAKKAD